VLGPGLIGGSLLLAMRERMPTTEIRAWARRQEAVDQMTSQPGLVDFASCSVGEVVESADLAILAMPIGAMAEVVSQFPESLSSESLLVTDVGSVKGSVMREIGTLVREKGAHFVGSHPMAGSEKKGLDHAAADLFVDAAVILTADGSDGREESDLEKLRFFWGLLGSRVSSMSAQRHDELVGWISHLPHLVAAALSRVVLGTESEAGEYSGGGLRDTTRVSGGPEDMWTGILCDNRSVLSEQLGRFIEELESWKMALDELDRDQLRGFLSEARRFRETL